MNVFLYNTQNFSNICTISRTLEFFGVKKCYIYDNHNIIREKYGKSYTRKLRTQSAGAFEKIEFIKVENYIDFLKSYNGRKIITLPDETVMDLDDFKYEHNDIIIFGNESHGLPDDIISIADQKIFIQGSGKTQSLNLSNTAAIVIHSIMSKNG